MMKQISKLLEESRYEGRREPGVNTIVAEADEFLPRDKPCYVTDRGMYKGAFVRSFDGDRKLSPYEVDRLLEDKTQPAHDAEIVPEATMEDLDKNLLNALLQRQRALHPRLFASYGDEEMAIAMRVAAKDKAEILRPTL